MTDENTEAGPSVGRWITDPATRAWLYNVAIAATPLLVALGVLTDEVAGHVLAIAGAVLGTTGLALARANTR